MKKRTLCLLLAGAMSLSLLGGCGDGKTTDKKVEDALNDFVSAVENRDEDAVLDALEGLADAMGGEEEHSAPAGDEGAFPRDPRWDELQPGETAVQFGDVFIKSGMTLGEAVELIDNSELFLTMSSRFDFDEPGTVKLSNQANSFNCIVSCDGEEKFEFYYVNFLPGEPGDTFDKRDCPIWLVRPFGQVEDGRIRTTLGTASEINAMREEDVQKLADTAFAGLGAEVDSSKITSKGVNLIRYTVKNYRYDCLCDGYALYESMRTGDQKGIPCYSTFSFVYETGELYRWSVDEVDGRSSSKYKNYDYFTWGPENPTE